MPVPDFQTLMLPLLKIFSDQKEHSIPETTESLAQTFSLNDEELNEVLPSGKQTRFQNRIGWARTYLTKAKLIETSRRAHYRITERGLQILQQNPNRIDMKFLEQFPEYLEFREKDNIVIRPTKEIELEKQEKTPEEILEDAYD